MFTVNTGSTLPTGLSLDAATGAVTGTPTTSGSFTILVTDSTPVTPLTDTSCTLTINPAISLTCPVVRTGTVGVVVNFAAITGSGGTGALTYSIATGSLPTGLTLNPSTGAITGTPSTSGTFTVKATDTVGAVSASNCSYTINPAVSLTCPVVRTGTVGVAVNFAAITGSGGTGSLTYSIATGSLPTGLTLNPSTGAITGIPSTSGTFTVKATDTVGAVSASNCSYTINPAVSLTCPVVRTGTVGVAVNFAAITGSGGTGSLTYSIATGSLPTGLTLNPSTGAITGTPSTSGTFTVQATDTLGAVSASNCSYTINPAVSLTCPVVRTGTVGVVVNFAAITGTGGTGSLTYSIATGSLPTGLTLNPSTGAITGTPSTSGTFTVQATDTLGAVSASNCSYTINAAISLTCPVTTSGTIGTAVNFSAITGTGGTGSLTYSVATGSLPTGLSLNTSTGAITGVPTTTGTFTVQATDTLGATSGSTCSYTINSGISLTCPAITTGTVGVAVNFLAITATGGTGSLTYSVATGSLPNGLSLNTSTGAITGTPTVSGTFTIKATDGAGSQSGTTCSYTINPAITLTCPATVTGTVGVPVSFSAITASGGTGSIAYSLGTGSLPAGLSLNTSTGAITGTPSAAGTFTIKATDSLGAISASPCSYTISAGISLTCPIVTSGTIGVAVNFSAITATGGTGSLTYSVGTGTLPTGLSLNTSTGAITGTPSAAGTFTIKATDSLGATGNTCSYTINPAVSLTCPLVTSGTVGVAVSFSAITSSGGTGSLTYSIATGSLPAGLSLNSSTGAVTGTPSAAGTFTVKATDTVGAVSGSTCSYTINAAISLTCPVATSGTVGAAVSFSAITSSGGTGTITYSVATGSLPTGLTLNTSTGAITGTPSTAGTFTVKATDSVGATTTSNCSYTISGGISVTCPTTTSGTVGVAVSFSAITATGGTGTITFSIGTGSLPSGLTLNSSTGAISGTPSASGTFTVKATDSVGATGTTCSYTINAAISLTCPAVTAGTVGIAFSPGAITISGGTSPFTFSLGTGTLPSGLSLNTSTGAITGTPTASGTFTVKVTDGVGATGNTCSYTINSQLLVTCSTVTAGTVGIAFNSPAITVSGGSSPYTYSIVGSLPSGLSLNPGTGAVTGTPTSSGSFSVKVTDSVGATGTQCPITINPTISVTCSAVTTGTVGASFSSAAITTTGGTLPYTYSIGTGTLPSGLTLNTTTGAVTGTPTASGTFTVKVTDAVGATGSTCPFTINSALSVTCSATTTGTVGVAFNSAALTVTGGTAPYSYSIVGSLPSGLTLNTSTGAVNGTPTASGNFTIRVTDTAGATSSTCAITINGTLSATCPTVTSGTVGTAFNTSAITVSGGTSPYTFTIGSGTLPSGLTLSSTTGAIIGTPSASGTFTVKVTDSNGATSSGCSYTITPTPALSSPNVTTAIQGQVPISLSVLATNVPNGSTVTWTNNGVTTTGIPVSLGTDATTGNPNITFTVTTTLLNVVGTASYLVTDPISGATSNQLSFTINAPAISINGLSITSAAANGGPPANTSIPITITGTNFIATGSTCAQGASCTLSGATPAFPTTIVWTNSGVRTQITPTSVSPTRLIASIPANLLASTSSSVTIGVINVNGATPVATLPFTIFAGPVITGVTATTSTIAHPAQVVAGSGAQTLTISGTGFPTSVLPVVTWVGSSGTTVLTVTSAIGINPVTATLPATLVALGGTATVTLFDPSPNSLVTSNAFTFTIVNPTTTSMTLSGGGTAAAIAGTPNTARIVINGTNFLPQTTNGLTSTPITGSVVTWCNSCSSFSTLVTTYVSSTQLTAVVPASLLTTAGSAVVSVINLTPSVTVVPPGTGNQTFTISPGPALTGVTPTFLIAQPGTTSGTQTITLCGTNLPATPIVYWTFPGNVPATATLSNVTASSSTTACTGTQTGTPTGSITATVDIASLLQNTGTASIYVTDSVSQAPSNILSLRITSGPVINSNGLSPSSASVGITTDVTLTISGTNFKTGDTVSWTPSSTGVPLLISATSGTVGQSYISGNITSTSITVNLASGLFATAGTATITVIDASNTSNAATFTIAAPSLTSISPNGTTAGFPTAINLVVSGSNFNNSSVVTWCNSCSGVPQLLTPTIGNITVNQLTVSVPASYFANATTTPVLVGVNNGPSGSTTPSTNTQNFSIGTIVLNSLRTSSAAAGTAPNFPLLLGGINFTSASTVTFSSGGVATTIPSTFIDSANIQIYIPAAQLATPGTYSIAVVNGSSTSNSQPFTVTGPTITSLLRNGVAVTGSPAQAATSFPLTISGTNFVTGSTVYWNNGSGPVALSTTFQDATNLVAIVTTTQTGTAGTALVTVQNTTAAISAPVTFSVGQSPTINTDSTGITDSNGVPLTSLPAGSTTTQILINGTNFTLASTVSWNNSGTAVTLSSGYLSATRITATIPTAQLLNTGSAQITVVNPTVPSGTVSSNPVTFTIANGTTPVLSTLSPSSALAGGAAFPLILSGTGFVNGSSILWNNGTTQTLAASYSSSTGQLSANVPASFIATAGTANVSVLNPGGGTSGTLVFTINSNQPSITALSPTMATAGSASFQLSVTGTNFVSGSVVQWNAGSSAVALQTVFNNSASLTAVVPASMLNTVGTVLVTVANPGTGGAAGPTSTAALFSVTPTGAPVINSGANSNGLAPSTAITGTSGFSLTINGSNYFSGSTVQWTVGTTVTQLTTSFISSNQLSAVVPASLLTTAGTAFVSVTNPGGSVSNLVTFTIGSAPGPTISSLSPSGATAGGPAYQMTVSGTNFATGSVVVWNTGSVSTSLATTVQSSTQLSALVPASLIATAGTIFIDVMNTGGAISNVQSYIISPAAAPSISTTGGLSPAVATTGSAAITMIVNGTNFTSASNVQWTAATTTALATVFVSSTQLNALVPNTLLAVAGTAFISVSNGTGNVSNSVPFTISAPGAPTISSSGGLLPASVSAGGAAFQLAVTGTNYATGSVVQWNNGTTTTALATVVLSSTQLTALVPATLTATAGTAFISVLNTGGAVSNIVGYSITSALSPTINTTGGLAPASATVGSTSIQLNVLGSNFLSTSVVQWNSGSGIQALATVFISNSQLSALIPTSLLSAAGSAFISVSNGNGVVSNTIAFAIVAQSGPTISTTNGLLPGSASAGAAAFQLVVIGSNFVSGSTVYWNAGTPQALTTSYVSPTQLTAVVTAALIANSGTAFVSVQNPGTPAVSSNSVGFVIGASASLPVISASGGLLPAQAAAGSATFQLSVTGSNFQNGSIVQWNANGTAQNLTTGFGNSNSLTALVPATLVATPGIALITVLNPDKNLSNSVTFSISGSVPVLTQLSPATAAAGTQGLMLVATGTGFVNGATVSWGGTALPTTFNSASQLTATVGSTQLATPGSVSVIVQSPGGNSNSIAFAISGPLITLLSPATVTAGGPAFTLSVGGDNFVAGAVVSFGGTALSTTFVSANQVTASVPASLIATASSINVVVTNPGGSASPNFGFPVGAVPNITTIAPNSTSPGSPAFTLQVTGTNFANGDTVQWNGVALTTTFGSATTLSASVPANLIVNSGSVNVSVLHAGGVVSNAVQFTISAATLTSIAPNTAAAGSGTVQLTVAGTSFVNGSMVQWNGTAIPTTFVSATQLSSTVDTSLLQAVGTSFVAVVNPGGSTTPGVKFTVSGPTLTTISPTSATAGAASLTLTLTGTNFVNNSVASWNGTTLPTSVASATQATAQVSSTLLANAGTFVVVMTNPGGSVTAGQFFTLNAPVAPTVSGVTPASAVAGGSAFQLTVAGTGFVAGSVVQWNGTPVSTNFAGPTQLTALIDSSLIATAQTANINIQIPGAPLSATVKFPVNGPAITTLSPNTVSAGGPAFNLTVTGGNFIQGSSVQWNGTSLPTIYNSATQLTATVGANLIVSGGTASVTVQNGSSAISPPATFTIGPFTLVITTTLLPDAIVGSNYSQILAATGGSPPYNWTVTSGTLPAGIVLDSPTGTLSGIATAALTGNVSFTVTDSVSRTIAKSIPFRAVAPLTITTTTPLNSAPAGVAFSQILAAAGGTTPYTWGLSGNLPTGLVLNTSTGQISGTPTVPGSYNFTINISDSRNQSTSVPFSQTINVAGITFGGITATSNSAQQLPVSLTLASPYSVPLTGSLTMVFTSAVGATDPAIQFSTGGLTTNFTIPAGSTQATFGTQQSVLVLTGTVAGTITISASIQAAGAGVTPPTVPSIVTTIAKAAPVITSATLTTSGTNLIVSLTGYSNTRDMTTVNLQFTAAAGSTLTAAPIAVNVAPTFASWYQSAASANVGSQFTYSVPISFTGSINAIGGVSVTMVNSAGTSASATATRQ